MVYITAIKRLAKRCTDQSKRTAALETRLQNLADALSALAGDLVVADDKHAAHISVFLEALEDLSGRIGSLETDQPGRDVAA